MDKVYCPWCRREMKLGESLPFSGVFAFYCKCGAVSPNEGGAEEALKAALKRPLQKPLTLEEAKKEFALWFEYPPNIFNPRACLLPELYSSDYRAESTYGIKWRCWATKPTDEERAEAKWNE